MSLEDAIMGGIVFKGKKEGLKKDENILIGPARGSFAGSLVSYLACITKVDPIKYGLMFQRAVNTGRCMQLSFGI